MAGFSDVQSAMTAAVAALRAGDYQTALVEAVAAQALLAITPSGGRSAGGGSQNVTWDAAGISNFCDRVQRLANQARGIQSTLQQPVLPQEFGSAQWAYGSQGGW